MITITQLNKAEMVINAEMIETVETAPDTIITMTTGRKFITRDSIDDVVEKVMAYQKAVRSRLIDSL